MPLDDGRRLRPCLADLVGSDHGVHRLAGLFVRLREDPAERIASLHLGADRQQMRQPDSRIDRVLRAGAAAAKRNDGQTDVARRDRANESRRGSLTARSTGALGR